MTAPGWPRLDLYLSRGRLAAFRDTLSAALVELDDAVRALARHRHEHQHHRRQHHDRQRREHRRRGRVHDGAQHGRLTAARPATARSLLSGGSAHTFEQE